MDPGPIVPEPSKLPYRGSLSPLSGLHRGTCRKRSSIEQQGSPASAAALGPRGAFEGTSSKLPSCLEPQ